MTSVLKEKLEQCRLRVEAGIDRLLPAADERPARLHAAMRYSLEAGGKRIRPALLFLGAELFDSSSDPLPAAVAVECLHTYTLIHDDLPSIDDSDLRRGRPACHKMFDEATAVLAGDALLTFAFELLAREYRKAPELALALIGDLAEAAGSRRLIGGQQEDVENEGRPVDRETLRYIHERKTAALISASLTMGLRFSRPAPEPLRRIEEVGQHLGLCFQIVDDILDATSSASAMGKPVGNDADSEKSTYVALHGLEGARAEARRQADQAVLLAEAVGGRNHLLIDLIRSMPDRLN